MKPAAHPASDLLALLQEHQAQILEELARHRDDMERLLHKSQDPTLPMESKCARPSRHAKTPALSSPSGDVQEPDSDAVKDEFSEETSVVDADDLMMQSSSKEKLGWDEEDEAKRRQAKARSLGRSASLSASEMERANRCGWLVHVVTSSAFETMTAFLICSNALFIGIEIELSVHFTESQMPASVQVIGLIYTGAFALELLLRVLTHGCSMFWKRQWAWNLLDLFVVLCSLWELLVLVAAALFPGFKVDSISVLTSLRILRILRITRLIRGNASHGTMRFLRALRTLIHSIVYTLKEVAWAGVFQILIMYFFSLALTQGAVAYLRTNPDPDPRLSKYWGHLSASMATLFMAVTGGISWEVASDPLWEISWIHWWLFLFYVSFTVLAVLNVMTGVFCQSAIKSAQHDHELLLQNMLAEKDDHLKRIKDLFAKLDHDGSGTVTLAELEDHMSDPSVQAFFESLELSITDVWSFFKLLESNVGCDIEPDAFFEGCQRLKGYARSLDLAKLMHQTQTLGKRQVDFMNHMEEQMEQMWAKLHLQDKMRTASPAIVKRGLWLSVLMSWT
ncbi:unnamed protein product [Effrenium voratum]|uniref:EF-hand domain-containing protein n=1 Tax=Effrenium voratum TaxID=2562239 RepID=A0AA36JSV1_9DINO|nr:unnamed protein product [Effrenium voratum]CAJ1416727.1 unnamed protein product [Effrenium voratum]